jgi:hypothetical protein
MSSVLSSLFGGQPQMPKTVLTPQTVEKQQAEYSRDEVLARLAKLRRATLVSDLSQPNVKRKMLGAGT